MPRRSAPWSALAVAAGGSPGDFEAVEPGLADGEEQHVRLVPGDVGSSLVDSSHGTGARVGPQPRGGSAGGIRGAGSAVFRLAVPHPTVRTRGAWRLVLPDGSRGARPAGRTGSGHMPAAADLMSAAKVETSV